MKRTVAIINFNTPELTECAIMSLRKHGGEDYEVIVFDNSQDLTIQAGTLGNDPIEEMTITARPFKKRMKGVKIIDNTDGRIINFDEFLECYPYRNSRLGVFKSSVWGSAKHIYTVQKLWDIINKPFILMESDILLKQDINQLWMEDKAAVGHLQRNQPGNKFNVPRLLPFLCFMNVPVLKANGARYFDPDRCWGLKPDENDRGNWYDTGACLLEDVIRTKPALQGWHIDLHPIIEHYGGGSWHQGDLKRQAEWLKHNEQLWSLPPTPPKEKGVDEVSKPQQAKRTNRKE